VRITISPRKTFLWFWLVPIVLYGCSSVDPLSTPEGNRLEDDEQRLWKTVIEEQKRLDRSGTLYEDPVITSYVNEVVQKLMTSTVRSSPLTVQVKIVKNPLLNAFAFPNGVIYAHTGILARIENEAQLATLLGHELTHATHRHAIQAFRGVKRSSAALATFQMVTLPFGVFGAAATALGTVGYVASVSGYSRGNEREADREGLALAVTAGYAAAEAPKLFEHLKRDLEFRKIDEPFFFGSHPKLAERVKSYQELIADRYANQTGEIGEERYRRIMLPLFVENAKTDLAIGRFELAEESLGRVTSQRVDHPQALYLLGEVTRQRNGEGDQKRSEERYRQAIAADPTYPDPHRALGTLLLKRDEKDGARSELQRYLQLAPQAPDRAYVEQELRNLLGM
jgi:predicted Zn-dependent protease